MAEEQQQSQAQAAASQAANALVKKVAQQALRKVGAAFGLPGLIVSEIVGRFGKYLLMAAAAAIALILIIFLIIIVSIITLITGGEEATQPSTPAGICSTIPTTMTSAHIQRINDNEDIYRSAAAAANIPWEMLAAIHYEEHNNSRVTPSTLADDGVYQIVSKAYPYPPGHVLTDPEFLQQSLDAAHFIQNKATSGPVGRPLRADMNPGNPDDAQSIKDAFWGYNGRADYMRDIAASLGYDPVTEGYEGSFYVMNNWDAARVGMTIRFIDPDTGQLVVRTVSRDGAWKIFIGLRNATYDDAGKITQLNDICVIDGTTPTGCPMTGTITTPYGFNIADYISLGWHYGIDIWDGPVSAQIRSTITGTARTRTTLDGGFEVVVENARFAVYFLHLFSTGRVEGPVTVGQVIGLEDTSGLVTGEHLHYTIYKDGVRVNPTEYMPVSLNYTQPAGNDFTGISKPPASEGGWGTCNALP